MSFDSPTYDALVDSDAFVGLLNEQDANHETASQLFEMAKNQKLQLVTTSFVIAETATVLSSRVGQGLARTFLAYIEKIPSIHITEELQKEALELFRQQEKKRTSVVDCANVVVMRRFEIPRIFAFDEFYAKKMGLKAA